MDSVTGIQLKERLFGPVGIFAKPDTREEIHWEAKLLRTFDGFGLYHNHQLGPYRADFFIKSLGVVLECNGFEHHYYNAHKEREREQYITREYSLVRFDHTISLEKLVNAILRVKPGEVIRLFESQQ
jgi:very-short-patch-repair endonuclease